jgi:hypothetical protein
LKPDFTKYSLALIKGGEIIYRAEGTGLRPLVECVAKLMGEQAGCILHDKIVGLAAAKLAVHSGIVCGVMADIASKPAMEFLDENDIPITANHIVDNIKGRDGAGVCPMEQKAIATDDCAILFNEFRNMMGV